MFDFSKKLRKEEPKESRSILFENKIPSLKEKNYYIIDKSLDGDAPKQFLKAYLYERGGEVYKSKLRTWRGFIVKTAEKWYPQESIIEYLINQIGEVLGLNMNKCRLMKINGQIRFMSEYFLDDSKYQMVHGAEICGQYLEDMDFAKRIAEDKSEARELFHFDFIADALIEIFGNDSEEILLHLVRLIIFDAIVGNNDRHFIIGRF